MRRSRLPAAARGFTLAEAAIAFLVIVLLIGTALATFQAQTEARAVGDTQRTLEQAREAMLGFAVRNGRLPCPASAISLGAESFCTDGNEANPCGAAIFVPPNPDPGHGRCSHPDGFVPAIALGVGPMQVQPEPGELPGRLIDRWSQPIRYAVTQVAGPGGAITPRPFTASGGLRQIILAPVNPDLQVCLQGTGLTVGTADILCGAGVAGFSTAAVMFSTGKNALGAGADGTPPGNDDLENLDGDRVFVAREPGPGADDLVVSISTNILFGRLIGGGAL